MDKPKCAICGWNLIGRIPDSGGLCPDCEQNAKDAATVPTPEEIAMADRAAKRAVERAKQRAELYQEVCREVLREEPGPDCTIDLETVEGIADCLLHDFDASLIIRRVRSDGQPQGVWYCYFEIDGIEEKPGTDKDLDAAILKAALHVVEEV